MSDDNFWPKGQRPGDFPGGPVVRNPPSNAGDEGLIPGGGSKIPHAAGQLSPRTATREKPTRRGEESARHGGDPLQPKEKKKG